MERRFRFISNSLIFYGTGAAEGIPCPFCDCLICQNARKKGEAEVRRRTISCNHTHEDHLAYMMMNLRNMATVRQVEPLHSYLTDKAYDIVSFYENSVLILKGLTTKLAEDGIIAFHQLEFIKKKLITGMEVTPLRGNHIGNMGENSANYLIKLPDGRMLCYGLVS